MTLAYFDCFSGISGDMTLGALVDAGLPIVVLRSELAKLNLPGYTLSSEKVRRSGLAATKVHVVLDDKEQPARHLADIQAIINGSSLSPVVKQKSLSIFQRLAEVEAKVHGTTPDKVHFQRTDSPARPASPATWSTSRSLVASWSASRRASTPATPPPATPAGTRPRASRWPTSDVT